MLGRPTRESENFITRLAKQETSNSFKMDEEDEPSN